MIPVLQFETDSFQIKLYYLEVEIIQLKITKYTNKTKEQQQ